MNETKHPLPWSLVVAQRNTLILDGSGKVLADIRCGNETAEQIVDAANALQPRWRTVAKDGKPNCIGWYLCTVPEHGFPVLRHVNVPDDIKDFICWMPVPDAPPNPDPFTKWKRGQMELPDDCVEWCRAAWDAALETVKSQNNI